MVAPRQQVGRHRTTAMRSAVNARLEDISFRAGVTALVVVAALVVGGTIAAVDLTAYGGPPAARHAPAAQALPTTPQTASTAPASGPETGLPRLRHDAGPPRHTAVPVAAAVPAAQTSPSSPSASPPRPGHHHRPAFPGWSRRPGGSLPEHRHGHHPGHGQPPGDGQGQQGGDGHSWHGRGPHGRHAGPHERDRPGRHARHHAGRHERDQGGAAARHHASRPGADPHGLLAGQIASQR